MKEIVPAIVIDGGAGTGKGTVRAIVAEHFGFHGLDSGAIYRAAGLLAYSNGASLSDTGFLVQAIDSLDLSFVGKEIFLNGENKTKLIRSDAVGKFAATIAIHPEVREAVKRHHARMRVSPGLVVDGRDGAREIEEPTCKIFLKCSQQERARRRVLQNQELGLPSNYEDILREMKERDGRNKGRAVAPLCPHEDALVINTALIPAVEVARRVIRKAEFFLTALQMGERQEALAGNSY